MRTHVRPQPATMQQKAALPPVHTQAAVAPAPAIGGVAGLAEAVRFAPRLADISDEAPDEPPAQARAAVRQATPGRLSGAKRQRAVATGLPPGAGPAVVATAQTQEAARSVTSGTAPDRTGMPAPLKAGIEALSGMSMDDVRVHYDSAAPSRMGALAFAQGTDIQVARGQERHLPHEAWHVVQQKQGRVRPLARWAGASINDDPGLEHEADVMGKRALALGATGSVRAARPRPFSVSTSPDGGVVVQPVWDNDGSGDDDHGAENANVEEAPIAMTQITSKGKARLPPNVLGNMFANRLSALGLNLTPELLGKAYEAWLKAGVTTRGQLRLLIGDLSDAKDDPVQLAREGHTWSRNGGYTGTSNAFPYNEVIYFRDGGGNIDFDADPAAQSASYKDKEDSNFDATQITWKAPIVPGSEVEMNNDLTDKDLGVMPSAKSVNLAKASRSQHFAIADMLRGIHHSDREGKLTWHHLSTKYEMVLVDMEVHAKHGHNGGVYLWGQ